MSTRYFGACLRCSLSSWCAHGLVFAWRMPESCTWLPPTRRWNAGCTMQKRLCGPRHPLRPTGREHYRHPNDASGTTCWEKSLPIVPPLLPSISAMGTPPWLSARRRSLIFQNRISSSRRKSPMPGLWPIMPREKSWQPSRAPGRQRRSRRPSGTSPRSLPIPVERRIPCSCMESCTRWYRSPGRRHCWEPHRSDYRTPW